VTALLQLYAEAWQRCDDRTADAAVASRVEADVVDSPATGGDRRTPTAQDDATTVRDRTG
jgi:hypothetical protein